MDIISLLNTGVRIFLLMAGGAVIYKIATDYVAKKKIKSQQQPITVVRDEIKNKPEGDL